MSSTILSILVTSSRSIPLEFCILGWPRLLYLPDQLQHFTLLKVRHITRFDNLDALPEWLGNFSSLEYLVLFNCKKLKKLPSISALKQPDQALW